MYKPQKSEAEQQAFFNKSYDKFLQAKSATGEIDLYYRIADTTVCLKFAGDRLIPFLTPALDHLRLNNISNADFTICIWDSESTKIEMVPPPCTKDSFTDRGDIWGFNSRRTKAAFHWIECSVNLVDFENNTGIYWIKTADTLPYWVIASPLRTLFHWWMEKNGCQLLHAAAVGTENGAVLITGKGGVGKSTAALSCLQAGLFYTADDYVITKLEPVPSVISLYCTAKLNADHVVNFPDLARFIKNTEKLDQEKAVIFLNPHLGQKLITEMPLKAILTPQIVDHTDSHIKSVSRWDIQRALSFTTMSQLPYVGCHTHEYISKLASSLPHYILETGNNFSRIPESISDFLSDLDNYSSINDIDPWSLYHKEERPLVSVIIPVFNAEQFIGEAVENVLSQNYPALEIIIINDGSTDNSEAIIKNLPVDIRYFSQDNCGPSAARNKGIQDASGEFITFLDADDIWHPLKLQIQIDYLQKNHSIMLTLSKINNFVEPGCNIHPDKLQSILKNEQINLASLVAHKAVFDQIGGFNPHYHVSEDFDWITRAKDAGIPMVILPEVLLQRRIHNFNISFTQPQACMANRFHILKEFKSS